MVDISLHKSAHCRPERVHRAEEHVRVFKLHGRKRWSNWWHFNAVWSRKILANFWGDCLRRLSRWQIPYSCRCYKCSKSPQAHIAVGILMYFVGILGFLVLFAPSGLAFYLCSKNKISQVSPALTQKRQPSARHPRHVTEVMRPRSGHRLLPTTKLSTTCRPAQPPKIRSPCRCDELVRHPLMITGFY